MEVHWTTGSGGDILPTSVPTLAADGSNWSIFLTKFKAAVSAKRKWGHFDGSKTRPQLHLPPQIQPLDPNDPEQVAAALIANQDATAAA